MSTTPRPHAVAPSPGSLGELIRLLRDGHGWSLEDLCGVAGYRSRSALHIVEVGRARFPGPTRRVAAAFGLSPATLDPAAPPTETTWQLAGHPAKLAAVRAFAARCGVTIAEGGDGP